MGRFLLNILMFFAERVRALFLALALTVAVKILGALALERFEPVAPAHTNEYRAALTPGTSE